uniref:Uncharacterized protein n=1 Tax=Caenorhabditis tropicalis TaxID=1561998 RepID=A0A1I7TR97_9PELO
MPRLPMAPNRADVGSQRSPYRYAKVFGVPGLNNIFQNKTSLDEPWSFTDLPSHSIHLLKPLLYQQRHRRRKIRPQQLNSPKCNLWILLAKISGSQVSTFLSIDNQNFEKMTK